MMLIAIFLCALLYAQSSMAADLWIYGGIGAAQSTVNTKPNLWKQEALPYQFQGTDLGWRTGVGVGLSPGVFLELGAVSIGGPSIHSVFVPDTHLHHGRCVKRCDQLYTLDLTDQYLGGEMVMGYQMTLWGVIRPYVKGGMAGFAHTHSGTLTGPTGRRWHFHGDDPSSTENFSGVMMAGVVGGGLCGQAYRGILACGDVEKFFPVAHTANPLIDTGAGGPVLTTFQVRVPLTGWR